MVADTKTKGLTRALAAASLVFTLTSKAALGYLEQIPVETFAKMREVERYQMRIAEKLYLRGEFKAAMSEYEKYLTLYERSLGAPYAQLMWSHCLVKQRKVYTAIREGFLSVIDYWPDSHEAALAAYLIGWNYKNAGELPNAEKAYLRAIHDYESHHVAVLSKWDLTELYGEQKKQVQRVAIWKDLSYKVKRTKENSSILVSASRSLCSHHFYNGDFPEGLKALETSYKTTSLIYYIYIHARSPVNTLTGDPNKKPLGEKLADQAIAYIRKQTPATVGTDDEKKQIHKCYSYMADLHAYARRDREGLQTWEQLGKILGMDDGIRSSMADWHIARKRFAEGRKLHEQFQDKIKGLEKIADVYADKRKDYQPEKAVDTYNRIISLDDKENKGTWDGKIAATWFNAKKWDEAIAAYQVLLKSAPDKFGTWYRQIGLCYEYSNRIPTAIQSYRQSDDFPKVYFDIARCHRKLKQWKEALVVYHQARADKGAAPEASIQIGFTYEDSGSRENAIKWFQQTCKLYPKNSQASVAHAHLQREYKISITLGGATDDK
ncbi:MAG: hypothetical protein CMO66_07065 [Verrucomicrobiales bacterium]|nr:hypothetical protein [Verrucomicrobiales bacterium]